MTESQTPAADWYPDPFGRHELRYWDGTAWTEHVASHGRQSTDAPTGEAKMPVGSQSPDKVQAQVDKHLDAAAKQGSVTDVAFDGDGTIFGEPILVVNQKAKLIEVNNEYAIYDKAGRPVGRRSPGGPEHGQEGAASPGLGRSVPHTQAPSRGHARQRLDAGDPAGQVGEVPRDRPGRLGNDLGEVAQENVFGKIRFSYNVGGRRVGGIQAENWRAWNFSLVDEGDTEVARITKTFEGVAKTLFTTADNYVLQVHRPLDEPLRSLVVASALTVDTALKQDNRGLG